MSGCLAGDFDGQGASASLVGKRSGSPTRDFDGQGTMRKKEDSGWKGQDVEPRIRMVRGVNGQEARNKTLAGS